MTDPDNEDDQGGGGFRAEELPLLLLWNFAVSLLYFQRCGKKWIMYFLGII